MWTTSLTGHDPHLRIVILAGGVGSRFWPASTPARPKPLLALSGSGRPLIRETVERALALVPRERLSILAGEHLARPFLDELPELGRDHLWVEPRARGTGPVLAWAAHRIWKEDPKAVMVSLHADHVIHPGEALVDLAGKAAALFRNQDLIGSIAVPPTRPETGYGYLRPGEPIPDREVAAFRVGAFVEKPDLARAQALLSQGCLWNSGIFILPVAPFLEEIRTHAPEIGDHLRLLDEGRVETFFDAVPNISVDEAVMERSRHVGAVRATFEWDDVGSWESLSRTLPADVSGNVSVGEVYPIDSGNSIVWTEEGPVVLFGVEGLVVVRSGGMTFVASRKSAGEIKKHLAQLPEHLVNPDSAGSKDR